MAAEKVDVPGGFPETDLPEEHDGGGEFSCGVPSGAHDNVAQSPDD